MTNAQSPLWHYTMPGMDHERVVNINAGQAIAAKLRLAAGGDVHPGAGRNPRSEE
jgi:hypothetical protein